VVAEGRGWWGGEEDGGEGERGLEAQGSGGRGELSAGAEVSRAVEEHVRDGVVDGLGRRGAVGAGGADGGGLRRFGEALTDGAGAGASQEETGSTGLLRVGVGGVACEERRKAC
jgi:hypothetical protein